MLRPIVEAAGYRVVGRRGRSERRPGHRRRRAQRLDRSGCDDDLAAHASPKPPDKKDESIYRYDRAGLLMALKSAGAGRGK